MEKGNSLTSCLKSMDRKEHRRDRSASKFHIQQNYIRSSFFPSHSTYSSLQLSCLSDLLNQMTNPRAGKKGTVHYHCASGDRSFYLLSIVQKKVSFRIVSIMAQPHIPEIKLMVILSNLHHIVQADLITVLNSKD